MGTGRGALPGRHWGAAVSEAGLVTLFFRHLAVHREHYEVVNGVPRAYAGRRGLGPRGKTTSEPSRIAPPTRHGFREPLAKAATPRRAPKSTLNVRIGRRPGWTPTGGQGLTPARTAFSASLKRISMELNPASMSRPAHCITDSRSPTRS